MPFGIVGVLLVILLILVLIFSLVSYLAGPVLALAVFFFLVCVFMMLMILIQRPKGGGLTGAFGGVGGGQQTAFGAKVGDVLTWVTVGFFVAFLTLAMGLTWTIRDEQITQPGAEQTVSSGEDLPSDSDGRTSRVPDRAPGGVPVSTGSGGTDLAPAGAGDQPGNEP